ncbi:hypothetical protein AVEN_254030-1 [Araneus ventricosus]|uniref:Uncharacterized protein n=1 Tax=Araneus ventricosus TaxID=182803 RepID=A0A4Y2E8A9_ARAVE|nr:hypothetical protein AVEN_254030-1 [Araneus ventricosus]
MVVFVNKEGRTDVHDEEEQRRKSIATKDRVQRVPGSFRSNLDETCLITRRSRPLKINPVPTNSMRKSVSHKPVRLRCVNASERATCCKNRANASGIPGERAESKERNTCIAAIESTPVSTNWSVHSLSSWRASFSSSVPTACLSTSSVRGSRYSPSSEQEQSMWLVDL